MKTSNDLTNRINNFDNYYCFSDCSKTFSNGINEEKQIKKELSELTTEELIELKSQITNENSIETFKKFFESLPQPTEPTESQVLVENQTIVKYTQLSTIMTNAWFYFKKGIYISFSEALKASWRAFKVKAALVAGKASFSYRKATGEIREATGTLNSSLFQFTAKGVRKESKPDAIKYFDLEKNAWRCFRIERLIAA